MDWLSIPVNLSTRIGHDSLKRLACENKKTPKAAMNRKVRIKVIAMAITLFIPLCTKNPTTGCSKMAIMMAKNERNYNALCDVQYRKEDK